MNSLLTELSTTPKAESLHQAIQAHLQQLLNTRRGCVQHLPDYGLPDLVGIYQGLPGNVNQFLQEIRAAIDKYEPRLNYVRVELGEQQEQECVLHIIINANLADGAAIHFNSYFLSGGHAKIL